MYIYVQFNLKKTKGRMTIFFLIIFFCVIMDFFCNSTAPRRPGYDAAPSQQVATTITSKIHLRFPKSYLYWEPLMEFLRLCECYPWMEFSKKMGHPRWGPLRSQTTLGEIYLASIYMLLFPLGYLSMQSTERWTTIEWNLQRSLATSDQIYPAAINISIGICGWSL